MAWLAISLRRLRDDRAAALGLATLVLITAFVFSAAPRLLGWISDRALRDEVAAAPATIRDVQLVQERRIGLSSGDPLAEVDAAGAVLQEQVPPAVRNLFVARVFSVETPRWRVTAGTKTPSLLTLRIQQNVLDRIRIVSGRVPTGALQPVGPTDATPSPAGPALAYEVALSRATAEAIGVGLGDVLPLGLDSTDPLSRAHNDRTAAVVVGIFEVLDLADPYWSADTTLDQPTQRALSADNVFVNGIALLAPEAYPELMAATDEGGLRMRYAWRYQVDPSRLAAGHVGDLRVDLRRLESVFPVAAASAGAANGTILRTGLLRFIEAQQARWQSAQAVLASAAIGPAMIAGAALALIVLLGSGGRRSALGLARSRGASPGQVLGATIGEGLLLTIPPALIAMALAVLIVPTGVDPASLAIPLVVAALTIVLLVATIAGTARGISAVGRDRGGENRRSSPRRLVIDGLVIALAIGGAVLLLNRGVGAADSTADGGPADPFIAAVPALAGLAAGLLAIHLFSIPLRGLASLVGLRRDLVPVLGTRRTARSGSATPILLVLLATASVGAFSLAALAHLDRAAEAVAWQEVGAPFRLVEGAGRLPHDFDPLELPAVTAAAGAHEVRLVDSGQRGVDLLALDLAAYRDVVSGSAGDRPLPGALFVAGDDAIPAIVSPNGVVDGIHPGDRFELTVAGKTTSFVAAAVDEAFPTLPVGGPFVVVDRTLLAARRPDATFRTSTVFVRAPDAAADGIRQAMMTRVAGTSVAARAERSSTIRTAPVVVAVTIGLLAAFGVAVAYAAVALVAALALTGAARASETAHLRTIGLGRRESIGLTFVEHGPTVVLAVVGGIVFGLGLFVALRPGLGLAAIVGSTVEIALAVDPGQLGPLVIAILAVVVLAMAIGVAIQREPAPPTALRRGIE